MKKQYKIEKGKLICDGKTVFALGQSYYPSFHKYKYPVPPDGDRMGEMKKDLEQMAQMGFNHVRYAAIGETYLDQNGKVIVQTPFVDSMILVFAMITSEAASLIRSLPLYKASG